MQIGPYTMPNQLFVAPMAGVTDRPFRQLCRRLGAGYAVSEMVTSRKDLWTSLKTSRRTDHAGEPGPIAVQIAGTDAAMDAWMHDCGIVRVEMLETLIEIAPLLAGRTPARLTGAPAARSAPARHKPRVAVVTTTGGGAASVVDRLGMLGMEAMTPSTRLQEDLVVHGVRVSDSPIVDLTMASSPARYRAVLASLLASSDCDAVLAVVGSSAQFHPGFAVQPILDTPWSVKPLAVFLTPNAERSLTLLAENGISARPRPAPMRSRHSFVGHRRETPWWERLLTIFPAPPKQHSTKPMRSPCLLHSACR